MNVVVLGSGMMGRAIANDLQTLCNITKVTLVDNSKDSLKNAQQFLNNDHINYQHADVNQLDEIQSIFYQNDIAISAIPYSYNYKLAAISIETGTHFIDLGGNNDIVSQELDLTDTAKKANVTIIPDNGLAPGLVSVITKDIVETYDDIESVKLRVGGLPVHPKPPLNYEIVFSPNGLINEYQEDAIILDNGAIKQKQSMTEIELISFPKPFGEMEAFITSGGCSTLPYTYKNSIGYLDYKTIRYKGHCNRFKTLLDLGFGSTQKITIKDQHISPRDMLIKMLEMHLPKSNEDVVLLKVLSRCIKDNKSIEIEYEMIDYFDKKTGFTAMMRTTGFPISITADLIANNVIKKRGVYCPESIIPPQNLFDELAKRNIIINKSEHSIKE